MWDDNYMVASKFYISISFRTRADTCLLLRISYYPKNTLCRECNSNANILSTVHFSCCRVWLIYIYAFILSFDKHLFHSCIQQDLKVTVMKFLTFFLYKISLFLLYFGDLMDIIGYNFYECC